MNPSSPNLPPNPERRSFLTVGLSLALGWAAGTFTKRPFFESTSHPPTLKILFFTDVHATEEGTVPEQLKLCFAQMRRESADVVIGGGDFIHRGYLSNREVARRRYDLFQSVTQGFSFEPMIGNHDYVGLAPEDHSPPVANPRGLFLERFGLSRTWRSFERGGVKFFLLDSVEPVGGETIYQGKISSEQLEWIDQELAHVSDTQPIVVATHLPLRTIFLQQKTGPMEPLKPSLCVTNANELLQKFATKNLRLILQGHLHYNEDLRPNQLSFVMGGAVCGAWWKGSNFGTPPGYTILELGATDLQARYVPFPAFPSA